MSKIVVAITSTLVFFLLFASCKNEQKTKLPVTVGAIKAEALSVEAIIAKPTSLSAVIEVPGSLLPFEETDIRSEISGRIVQLNVKEGVNISKGALLIKLFDGDLQAQLRKLQVQLQIAEKTAERQKKLLEIGGISQQEYDLSELQINNLKADIELIKVNITKTEIRAPFNGRIGLKNISMGAYISPANIITTISQVNKLKLQFTIPEKYGSVVQRGQEVQFLLDGSLTTYKATVMATESSIEENTRSMTVRSVVNAIDKFLVPGSFAKVKMTLGKNENALMIPTQSVIPQGRTKQVILFKAGKALFATITTGVRDSANIQVLTGINNNDTVIITGLLFIRPGSDVTLSKVQ
ncbi:MAG: efflux RND transporter periplasmic adaptor subunit [Chitinophagaceae bacterium]